MAMPALLPGIAVGPARPWESGRMILEGVSDLVDVEVELPVSFVAAGVVR